MLVFLGWEIIEIRQSDLCECMDIYMCALYSMVSFVLSFSFIQGCKKLFASSLHEINLYSRVV
jgi:hypothetical protein